LVLLGEGEITTEASPKSAHQEQPMQVTKGIDRDAGRPEGHCGADARIEHPLRQRRYDTRFDLQVDDAAASALFAVVSSYTPAMEGMPAVVNFNFSPDMGRMTA